MQKTFRELTNEELLLVSGGLSDSSFIVIGGSGGWGDDGPPSDPWGGGGPPNEPIDAGGGGGGGGGGFADEGGQDYTPADVNGDGTADPSFYRGEDGKIYYRATSAAGESTLFQVTKFTGTTGTSVTVTGNFGATGPIPQAGIVYATTTSSGVVGFEVDATNPKLVHPK
jgi:hypothetical protein